jgi:hypothetical protein
MADFLNAQREQGKVDVGITADKTYGFFWVGSGVGMLLLR